MNKNILLGHGSGGKLAAALVKDVFINRFGKADEFLTDSAVMQIDNTHLAFTTDSYVVDPVFFPGGNIGKLAVCGTVNDLAVSGAKPLYLTAGFIIEEGFSLDQLEEIATSMASEAEKAGVKIVAGDTKVVNKGKCDKIFINTSGIGQIQPQHTHISKGLNCKPGDKIIINGYIAEHATAIMAIRNSIEFNPVIKTDCASLNHMISDVLQHKCEGIKFMRDATRGGIATVLCELTQNRNFGILVEESKIPVSETVAGFCEIFGYEPIYMANEGKVIIVADSSIADEVVNIIKKSPYGTNAVIIGEITEENTGKVLMHTVIGGKRIIDMLSGEQLPRIC